MNAKPMYHPPRWLVALLLLAIAVAGAMVMTAAGATTPDPRPTAVVRVSGDTARVIVTVYAKCNPGCPTSYSYAYAFGSNVAAPVTHTKAGTTDTLLVTPRIGAVGQTVVTPSKGSVKGAPATVSWSIPAFVPPPIVDSVKARVDTSLVIEYWAMLYTPPNAPLVKWKPSPTYVGPFEWYHVGTGAHMDLSQFVWYEGDSLRAVARLRLDSAGVRVREVAAPMASWQTLGTSLVRVHVVGALRDTAYYVGLPCNCASPPDATGAARLRLRNGQFRYEFPTRSVGYRAAQ